MDKNELTYGKCGGCGEGIKPGTVHIYDRAERKCAIHNREETIWTGEHQQYVPTTAEAQPELPGVESTLAERGKRYGDFQGEARAIQDIKRILFPSDGPAIDIADDCRQAAEMIVMKLVRAMRGDPNYADNWHDIAGYARLVEKRLSVDASWVDRAH